MALFYLEDSRRIHPWRREDSRGAHQCSWGWGGWCRESEREKEHMHARERERETHSGRERKSVWLLLLYIFFSLGLPYANSAQPGVLFYLKSSLWSSDLSLTFFCSIFVLLSLPYLLATAILDCFSLFYLLITFIINKCLVSKMFFSEFCDLIQWINGIKGGSPWNLSL